MGLEQVDLETLKRRLGLCLDDFREERGLFLRDPNVAVVNFNDFAYLDSVRLIEEIPFGILNKLRMQLSAEPGKYIGRGRTGLVCTTDTREVVVPIYLLIEPELTKGFGAKVATEIKERSSRMEHPLVLARKDLGGTRDVSAYNLAAYCR